jgi:hypothetical protein
MIGVAFTGSGKTIVFALPLVTFALEEELKMPITSGEGPFGMCTLMKADLEGYRVAQTYKTATFHLQVLCFVPPANLPCKHLKCCKGCVTAWPCLDIHRCEYLFSLAAKVSTSKRANLRAVYTLLSPLRYVNRYIDISLVRFVSNVSRRAD